MTSAPEVPVTATDNPQRAADFDSAVRAVSDLRRRLALAMATKNYPAVANYMRVRAMICRLKSAPS